MFLKSHKESVCVFLNKRRVERGGEVRKYKTPRVTNVTVVVRIVIGESFLIIIIDHKSESWGNI